MAAQAQATALPERQSIMLEAAVADTAQVVQAARHLREELVALEAVEMAVELWQVLQCRQLPEPSTPAVEAVVEVQTCQLRQ
jgi:hypothetical protein